MRFKFAAVFAAALAAAPGVFAQGCAMCYTLAQAQDSRAARHLDYAILALLIPSVSLFAGVFIAAMRRSALDEDERRLAASDQTTNPSPLSPRAIRTASTEL